MPLDRETSQSLGMQILTALGITSTHVTSIRLQMWPSNFVELSVTYHVPRAGLDGVVQSLAEYELQPRSQPQADAGLTPS